MTSASARVLSDSLDKLKIGSKDLTSAKSSKKAPAESWEDEAEADERPDSFSSPIDDFPGAPPTSPVSPSVRTKATLSGSPFQTFPPFGMNGDWETDESPAQRTSSTADTEKRPEKTTSAASRLIAAGIGQKPPRRTAEQREYDQAMKLQEKKRRDAAKEEATKAQQAKEKAKLAMWED